MKHTIDLIKNFFEKGNWKYDYKEYDETHVVFSSGVNMNNAIGSLRIFVVVRQDYYWVNVLFNSAVEEKYYNQVAEYLHRAMSFDLTTMPPVVFCDRIPSHSGENAALHHWSVFCPCTAQ